MSWRGYGNLLNKLNTVLTILKKTEFKKYNTDEKGREARPNAENMDGREIDGKKNFCTFEKL